MNWSEVVVTVLANAVVVSVLVHFIKRWFDDRIETRLEYLRDSLNRRSRVSSALYSQREKTIFEFDDAARRLFGLCHEFLERGYGTYEAARLAYDEIYDVRADLNEARLRGKLVFTDRLISAADALYEPADVLSAHAGNVALYHLQQDPEWPPKEVLPNTAPRRRMRPEEMSSSAQYLMDNLWKQAKPALTAWTIEARESLSSPA